MIINICTEKGAEPIYQQIYEYLKAEIRSGNLKKGEKLPSERTLAAMLSISRNTVDLAYGQLVSEGYVENRSRSGYYAADIGGLFNMEEKSALPGKEIKKENVEYRYDFSPFGVDIASFPFTTWRRISNNCMNDLNSELFRLGDKQGDLTLRSAIAGYLHSSRGVSCSEEQVVVGAGTDYLLTLLAIMFSCSASVAFENPGYVRSLRIMTGLGLRCVAADLDESGINMEQLERSGASLAYVTPSHQYPTGIVMPVLRRRELIAWALDKPDRYIIEDDHDSEFRYRGKPIPALQGMEHPERVIYLGTFSRAIAPAIRVGYMVLPMELLERYRHTCSNFSCTVSRLEQAILTEFISSGCFERHLNRMRKLYRSRQEIMLAKLRELDNVVLSGENAGLYVIAGFKGVGDEDLLIAEAEAAGIRLCGTGQYYFDSEKKEAHSYVRGRIPQIMLGFANIPAKKLGAGMDELKKVVYNTEQL